MLRRMVYFLLLFMLVAPQVVQAEGKFDMGALLDNAAQEWKEAESGFKQASKLLKEKKVELKAFVDAQVERGFIETESFTNKIHQVVADIRSRMKDVLSEENMNKVVAAIEAMETKIEEGVNNGIIDSVTKKLELTSQQIKEARPILEQELHKRKQLLDHYLDKGGDAVAEFNKDNAQLCEEMGAKLKAIFSKEQMQKFSGWRNGVETQINTLLKEKR